MRAGYPVGLDADLFDYREHSESIWECVDSQGWDNFGVPSRSEWAALREAGCMALKGTGDRCNQWPLENAPFCSFHMERAVKWFLGWATDEQIFMERQRVANMVKDAHAAIAQARAIVAAAPDKERVYFYELAGQDLLKIGTSRSPKMRTAQFRTGKGCTFPPTCDPSTGRLIGDIPGGVAVERGLHARYRPLRVAGEWFRFTDELRADVGAMLSARLEESA